MIVFAAQFFDIMPFDLHIRFFFFLWIYIHDLGSDFAAADLLNQQCGAFQYIDRSGNIRSFFKTAGRVGTQVMPERGFA